MNVKSDSMSGAARRYAQLGWSVIPIRARGKRPLVPWVELQQRRAAAAEFERWFRQWPDANVGIVTGRISGLVVIDVDPVHGGSASLDAIVREHGPLPSGVEAVTGGGGRHLYFGHPGGTVANRAGVFPGIDVRGDGGCVVAPPSVHESGARYRWVPAHGAGERPLPVLPDWAIELLQAGPKRGHPLQHWRTLVGEGVSAGQRNSTLASLTGHLLWHGVDPDVVLELMLAWNRMRCRPALADEEVAAVVESIARRHVAAGAELDAPPYLPPEGEAAP